jgi:hypothetical protein
MADGFLIKIAEKHIRAESSEDDQAQWRPSMALGTEIHLPPRVPRYLHDGSLATEMICDLPLQTE